jgi:hypothetical protein
MTETTIYESPTLRATLTLADAARFEAEGADIVCFEPLSPPPANRGARPAQQPFGARFALKYGFNAVHVSPAENSWYQYPDLDACLAAVARVTRPGATAYGGSMGGYAATTYADALPVAKVIALGPQFSIRRAAVPFEQRWAAQAARIAFRPDAERVAQSCHHYIFFDPRNPDAQHASLIAKRAARVTLVRVPGGGHTVGAVMAESGCLSEVTLRILRGEPTQPELEALIRGRLRKSPRFYLNRAHHSPVEQRGALLRAGLALEPDNLRLRHAFGSWLQQIGRPAEAVPHLEAVARRRPAEARYKQHYLAACAAAGLPPAF